MKPSSAKRLVGKTIESIRMEKVEIGRRSFHTVETIRFTDGTVVYFTVQEGEADHYVTIEGFGPRGGQMN